MKRAKSFFKKILPDYLHRNHSLGLTLGFTLPELLVSVAIISVIVVVIVYNHRKFDNDIEITNVAYRVAVNIRQAQVYGISAREYTGAFASSFDVPYGTNYYMTSDPASKKSFVLFGDANTSVGSNEDIYDGPYINDCSLECIERVILGRGNIIKKFCIFENDGDHFCFAGDGQSIPGGGTYNNVDALSIVFKRPKPDARITLSKGGNGTPINMPGGTTLVATAICLESPLGKQKKVMVRDTGQISVEDVLPNDACFPAGSGSGGPGGGNPGGNPGGGGPPGGGGNEPGGGQGGGNEQ